MTDTDVPVFTISRHFDASIERVYDAWADPQKMVVWSGPPGAKVEIVEGEVVEGKRTIARTSSEATGEMYSLCLWRELTPHSRVVWEQSFCERDGTKTSPPFFDDWPLTLLTEVDLISKGSGTEVTLRWIPIEYTEAALEMFVKQMAGMRGGWGGSFDKLAEFLSVG